MIQPRKMTFEDKEAISALCWQEKEISKEHLPSRVKEACGYVIETDGEFIGFISITRLNNKPYIDYLLVASNQRTKGYGTMLIEEVQKHHNYLFLHVHHSNSDAIRLYKRCKFETVACRVGEHRDKICMAWSRKTIVKTVGSDQLKPRI